MEYHRRLVSHDGRVCWQHLDGSHHAVAQEDIDLINGLLGRADPFPDNGPRPNIVELALDDLRFVLDIAKKYEPGCYRADATITALAEVLAPMRAARARTVPKNAVPSVQRTAGVSPDIDVVRAAISFTSMTHDGLNGAREYAIARTAAASAARNVKRQIADTVRDLCKEAD